MKPRLLVMAALMLATAWLTASADPAVAQVPERYAGTYRIENWRSLEKQGLYHFFYLHPGGQFLLAASWPGHERSQFAGTWSVTEDRLYLNGWGQVDTNQGDWQTDFSRTFRIRVERGGFVLEPEPVKNRFGLLGWPNPFQFHRSQAVPNLPDLPLPSDSEALKRHIATLLAGRP